MKILEIVPSLSSGGAERFVVDLSNELSMMNHELVLCTLKDDSVEIDGFYKSEIVKNVIYKCLGYKKLNVSVFWKIYKTIQMIKPDVVHIHLGGAFFPCMFAIILYRKCKYVVTSHIKAQNERKANPLKFIVKKMLYKLHFFEMVAISPDNAKSIKEAFGRESVAMIYNGRNLLKKSVDYSTIKKKILKLRGDEDTVVFINIARCSLQKNHKRLITSFNELISKGYNAILLIIGDGYDSIYGNELKKFAGKNIIFLGAKHNIADYLLLSDFFCLSSDYEGMPITLIEALACRCIPLSTPVSGVVDLIEDNVTGFISSDFLQDSYTNKMIEAINKKDLIKRDKLSYIYEEKLSMNVCAKQYESLFDKISQ